MVIGSVNNRYLSLCRNVGLVAAASCMFAVFSFRKNSPARYFSADLAGPWILTSKPGAPRNDLKLLPLRANGCNDGREPARARRDHASAWRRRAFAIPPHGAVCGVAAS